MGNIYSQSGEKINLEEALKLTKNFRNRLNTGEPAEDCETFSIYYSIEILRDLINQENLMGLNIYFGETKDYKKQLILVGVDKEGDEDLSFIIDKALPPPPLHNKEMFRLNPDDGQ